MNFSTLIVFFGAQSKVKGILSRWTKNLKISSEFEQQRAVAVSATLLKCCRIQKVLPGDGHDKGRTQKHFTGLFGNFF